VNITQIQAKFADTLNRVLGTDVRATQCWDNRWCISGTARDAQKAAEWLVRNVKAVIVERVDDEELVETFIYLRVQ
jgi:hypothetical protein